MRPRKPPIHRKGLDFCEVAQTADDDKVMMVLRKESPKAIGQNTIGFQKGEHMFYDNPMSAMPNSKLRSSYPCAGARGVRRAEFPLRTLGSQRSLADSLTALLHGETTVSPTPFADPPFIPA